ncbi:integrase DNA-binding domain-containing protein [Holdemanella porci]
MNRRKDNKGVVLKDGECQRKNGTYDYRYVTRDGKRHAIYAKTLKELREKEKQ